MDQNGKNLDQNRISLGQVRPRVRIANRHRFRAGQRWGPRRNGDLQFILLLAGRFQLQADGRRWRIEPGTLLTLPAGWRHQLVAFEDGELCGCHCELAPGSWAAGDYRLDCDLPLRTTLAAAQRSDAIELFSQLARCFAELGPWRQERLGSLARSLVLRLGEAWHPTAEQVIPARVRAMVEAIREALPAGLDRHQLARRFGLTPAYVNELFKLHLGLPPTAVVNRERCQLAARLLQEGSSVQQAATAVGFTDPFYFSRVFRRYFMRSPKELRPGR